MEKTAQFVDLQSAHAASGVVAVSPFEDIAAVHALYHGRIFRYLLLSTRDRDAAETLAQDTFVNAWKARASFRGDCSIPTWLTRIATNLLRDHTRTETFRFWKRAAATAVDATELSASLPHPAANAERQLAAQEEMTRLWKQIDLLSPRQRSVFLLRYIEEMDLTEIAEATGMPLSTVKSHLYRAVDRIRAAHAADSGRRNG